MASQINVFEADPLGVAPAALVVLMSILAMLGIIANVATG
jgi:hypothetical protein